PAFSGMDACLGFANSFTNTSSGAASYVWNFGDGSTSTDANPTHTYAGIGTYTVKLVAMTSPGCTDSVSHDVKVNTKPTPAFSGTDACLGFANSFTNTSSGAASYMWNFGDGSTSTATNPTHTYGGTGTYTVKLIAMTSSGCTDSVSHDVKVNTHPTPAF